MKNTLPILFIILAAQIFCWVYASASSTIGPPGYYIPVLAKKFLKPTAEPDKWKKVQVPRPRFDGHTGRPVYHSEYPGVSHDHQTEYHQTYPPSRPHIIKILHYPVTFKKDADSKLEQARKDKPNLFYDLTGIYLTPELNETLSKLFPLCPLLKEIISSAAPYDKQYEEAETESSKDFSTSSSAEFEEDETTKSYNSDYNSTEAVEGQGEDHSKPVTIESDEIISSKSGKEEGSLSSAEQSTKSIQPLSDEYGDAPTSKIETDIKDSSEHGSSKVLPTRSDIDDTTTTEPKSSEKKSTELSEVTTRTQPISEEISVLSLTGSKEYIEDSVITSTKESAIESQEYDYIVTTESEEYNTEDSYTLSTVISEDFITDPIVHKYILRNDSEAVSESKSSEEKITENIDELSAKSEHSTSSSEYGSATTTIGSENKYEATTKLDEIETNEEPRKELTSNSEEYYVTSTEKSQKDEKLQTSTEVTTESDKYEDSSDKNDEKSIEEETPITYTYIDSSSEEVRYQLSSEKAGEIVASKIDESVEEQSTKSTEEISTESEELGIPSTEIIEIGASQKSTKGPSFYAPEYEDETYKEDSSTLKSGELESITSTESVSGILTTEKLLYEDKDEKTAETSEEKVSTSTTAFVLASDEDFKELRRGPSNEDISEEGTTEPQENKDFSTTWSEGVTITGIYTSDKSKSSEESTKSDGYNYSSEERSTTSRNEKIFESYFTRSDDYVDISSKSSSCEETSTEFSTHADEYLDISTEGIRSTLKSDVFATTKMYTEVNELDLNEEPSNKSNEEYDNRSTGKLEKESEISEEESTEGLSVKLTTELNSIDQTTSSTNGDTSHKEKERKRLKKLEDSNEKNKDLDGSGSSERINSKMSTESNEYEEGLNEKQTILPIGEPPTVSYEYYDMSTEKIKIDKEQKITKKPNSDSYENYEGSGGKESSKEESSVEESSGEESIEKATTTSGQSISATSTKYRDEPEASVRTSFTSNEKLESTEELPTSEHYQDYGKINENISKSIETYDADQSITAKSNESVSAEIESQEKHDKKEKCQKAAAKFLEWLKSHYNDKKHELSMPEEFENIAWNDVFGKNGDQVQCPYTTKTVLVLPDFASCTQFYYCIKGVAYNQKCPDGLKFNALKMHCDFPHNVHCFS